MKTAENRHRRKTGLLFRLIRLLILITVIDLILLTVYCLKTHPQRLEQTLGREQAEVIDRLKTLREESEEYGPLAEQPENYPEELLALAVKKSGSPSICAGLSGKERRACR